MGRHAAPQKGERAIAIELDHLGRVYRMGDEAVPALSDIHLSIAQGEFLAILGPSGSGKTTLLHLIGGLDRPSQGEIRVGGVALQSASSDQLSEYRRGRIGIVFQSYHLIGHLTALENVEQAMALAGVPLPERRQRAQALLDSVGMADRSRHRPSQLSGGQQQRVSIARALANDPDILLCDEPTGNLDSRSGQQVMEILLWLCREQGKTLILITHNPSLVEGADRVLELGDGKMVQLRGAPPSPPQSGRSAERRLGSLAWRDVLAYASRNMARVKARAVLTGLGVAIGVGAIVLMVSFGQGLQDNIVGQLNGLASLTQVQVSPSRASSGFGLSLAGTAASKPINDTTLQRFRHLPHVVGAWYDVNLLGQANLGRRSATVIATNLAPARFILSTFADHIEAGRLPKPGQQDVILLADRSARYLVRRGAHATLAELRGLIGQTVRVQFTNSVGSRGLGGSPFQKSVVRRLRIVALMGGATSYLPYASAGSILKSGYGAAALGPNAFLYDAAIVQADSQADVHAVAGRMGRLGYGTQTFSDFIRQISQVFLVVQSILGVIGGIALVVAGLGIANVMVVAVLERTREIGVLKAIGARRRDIRRLFLAESMIIGLGGGVVGLALGYAGGILVNLIVNAVIHRQGGHSVHLFAVTWPVALGALVFALLAALLSGIYPANKAAGLDPVAALRHD